MALPGLILPQKRVAQPHGPARIADRMGRPFAVLNPALGVFLPWSGQVALQGSQSGFSFYSTGFQPIAINSALVVPAGASATVLWVVDCAAANSSNPGLIIGSSLGGAGTAEFHFYPKYTDGNAYLRWAGSTAGSTSVSGANPGNIGGIYVLSLGPLGMQIWRNGALLASNTATPYRTANSSLTFNVGAVGSPMATCLLATFPTQYPAQFNRSLSRDPWQMYADEDVFVPMAGALYPTLSGVTYTPGTLTSAGFGIRVTAS